MTRLILREPNEGDEAQVWEYRAAHFAANDHVINGGGGLANAESYAKWLEHVRLMRSEETVSPGKVPSSTLIAIRKEDKKLVGIIDIRHRLNEHLLQFGGNIGYGIHPMERGKGYATEMLALALEECRKLGMDRVLLTCDRTNPASANVMKKNGAKMENEVEEDGEIIQRYWIEL